MHTFISSPLELFGKKIHVDVYLVKKYSPFACLLSGTTRERINE